jgi:hypothetical protein
MKNHSITGALRLIFKGIKQLKTAFPHKEFTIDGRLVGDIGEIIAALEYEIDLFDVVRKGHDGQTPDDRLVQIKATFKDSLTFRSVPDYYLGLKLYEGGTHEEIFNGPGKPIHDRYSHRSGIGKNLLSFPNADLRLLSAGINEKDRIPRHTCQQRDPDQRPQNVSSRKCSKATL